MSGRGEWIALTALWIVRGGWLGAWALFALVVAPVAFTVLPSSGIAGTIVGPVLSTLHYYGIAAGVTLAGLSLALGRGRGLAAIGLVLAVLCGLSEYGISRAIAEVRPAAFGEGATAEAAAAFGRLHQASQLVYAVIGAAIVMLIGLHAREDLRHGEPASGPAPPRFVANDPQPRP